MSSGIRKRVSTLGAKGRASRIPLDHHESRDKLQRSGLVVTLVVLALTVGWVASNIRLMPTGEKAPATASDNVLGIVLSSSHFNSWGRGRASPGPLAKVHAAWDDRCDACHQPGVSMTGFTGSARCENCHQGPVHHPNMKVDAREPANNCSACHRDHQGREFSLNESEDSTCVSCHKNVTTYTKNPAMNPTAITAFLKDMHPGLMTGDSQKGKADPGKLKFNHQLHMSLGLVAATEGSTKQGLYTYAQIADPVERERYLRNSELNPNDHQQAVQLRCDSCHVLDAGDRSARLAGAAINASQTAIPRQAGAYFQPVQYQANCRACHPLTVSLSAVTVAGEEPKPTRILTVPHGQQPAEIRATILAEFLKAAIAGRKDLLEQPTSLLDAPGMLSEANRKIREDVDRKVKIAEQVLFSPGRQGCYECHSFVDAKNQVIKDAEITETLFRKSADSFKVQPTNVPVIWYPKAWFNHTSHRASRCTECHATTTSKTSEDVLIPRIETCTQCHGPRSEHGEKGPTGGVRSNCVTCHRFHNGGNTLEDRGARIFGPVERLSNQDLMSGQQKAGKGL